MAEPRWHDLGPAKAFEEPPLRQIEVEGKPIALSFKDGRFGAVNGVCNHQGGPLGRGVLDGEYITCPWHYWKFHRETGLGEPGYEGDHVPRHEVKVEGGRLFVRLDPVTKRGRLPHPPHALARPVERAEGPTRVLGISTTAMDVRHPRYSTSEALLDVALAFAASDLGAETRRLRLAELSFRACEGFYSKSERACTWPCSITQMDKKDQMERVYEGLVHWADVILVATPIRWGAASSLYYRMVERLNCVQNQITLHDKVLMRDKVAAFVITGGQDNVQAVAGQMLGFFAEIGCVFPPFPYVAHSLGWASEDMERNVSYVAGSKELRAGAEALAKRAIETSKAVLGARLTEDRLPRGGRKAHTLDRPPRGPAPS